VLYDGKDINKATVDATIDISTINTREPKRDDHLRGPDFFDVAKYPSITFKSTKVEQAEMGRFKLTGNLTMHGITKTITLDVDGPTQEIIDPHGVKRIGASANTKLNRKDFGLMWNGLLETGGAMVGDEVKVELEVELVKPVAPKS
ncbi:MAG: YceI family protein, partial [Candidatus Melainabacteria bacterium]|nr:YceI family protein [Candidatus Melainabacteria bacterium]